MIIDDFNVGRIALGNQDIQSFDRRLAQFPAKAYPPLVIDSDAVLSSPITAKRLESVGWQRP
jgi:hypothetical protein